MGSFSETLAPETQAGKETTGDGVTKAVKPMVVKRSSESVISLENSRTGTSFILALCGGGILRAGNAVPQFPTCFP